jgi:hypothetical protein
MKFATVPICDACWLVEHAGAIEPVRLTEPKTEICYRCKRSTRSGVYVRREAETPNQNEGN